jgi:lipopolysaccharide export system protein LptA
MKNYLVILFLAGGVLILAAQTNDMTNVITNATTNMVGQIPAMTRTNSTSATGETNHPAASRPKEKITIHSDGAEHISLLGHWATYQDHVFVTGDRWKMTCEWLLANLPQTGGPTNIVAETNVIGDFLDEKDQKWHVTGDKGVYAYHVVNGVTNETVTLTGHPPRVEEGADTNTMTGDVIIYDVIAKLVTVTNSTGVFWNNHSENGALFGTNTPASKTSPF